jgi:phosphate butyryltransferase
MVKSIKELIEKAKKINSKTVVVACAADEHVLEAVELARKENIINGILVGNVELIKY